MPLLAADQGGDALIEFDGGLAGGTITLDPALGQLDIASNVTIEGPGAEELTVDAAGNTAVAYRPSGTGNAFGGGVFNEGTLTVANSTISGNSVSADAPSGSANAHGGGIYQSTGVPATLHNTIVAGNHAEHGGDDAHGRFDTAGSYNLIGIIDESQGFDGAGTLYGTVQSPLGPRLGPLADGGGPTSTHALLSDSPAIDAGSNDRASEAGLSRDQRGFHRIINGDGDRTAAVDIGAYEYGARYALVISTDDDENDGDYGPGDLSLREVLALAGELPGVDAVLFDDGLAGGSIILDPALGPLHVDSDVDLWGLGAERLTIDAAGNGRALYVPRGVHATIRDITVTGGSAEERGGGIQNAGTLAISNVTVSGNSAGADGGGIDNAGTLTITDTTLSDNAAGGSGGAIHNGGVLTLLCSTVSGNSAEGSGGGIANDRGTLALVNVTISGNSAEDSGAGIAHRAGTASLHNTIVAGNTLADATTDDVAGNYDPASSHNLIGVIDGSTGLDGTGTLFGRAGSSLDAMLGPLADKGVPRRRWPCCRAVRRWTEAATPGPTTPA